MNALLAVYRRLDEAQQRRWFRITATVLALLACGAVFGSLIGTSYRLQAQRSALTIALTGQNVQNGDPHAVSLYEKGTVTLDGRTYGGERYRQRPDLLFDQNGTIDVPGALATALLGEQYPGWAPRWLVDQPGTTWMLAMLMTAWFVLIIWMGLTVPFVLTLAGTGAVLGATVLVGWIRYSAGQEARVLHDGVRQALWAFGGIGMLTFTFVLLTRTALIALNRSNALCAVAYTVVKEASRTKLSLVFVVLILIMLPLLPIGLDPESPLRFRLQTFISRGLGFTFYLAACLTLFLSCATVAFEIRDRQIWQLVTKPVHRLTYILGKWLGVISVNLMIMIIAAVSVFTFIQYLREQPVSRDMSGYEDAQQVRDAVLTARVGSPPVFHELTAEQLRTRVDDTISNHPELAAMERVPVEARREIQAGIEAAHEIGQRTVPPWRPPLPPGERTFLFDGLEAAKRDGSMLTLRYRFHIMRDDEHESFKAVFIFNGDPELRVHRTYVPTLSHVLPISPELIRDDGTLTVTIVNLYQPSPTKRGAGALNFEAKDFELLHKVGTFEANFFRAVFIDWVKLAFLAMLGICCATFLSFPVACLMSFTIFLAGTFGPFVAISIENYGVLPAESVDWGDIGMVIIWLFKSVIRLVAILVVFLLHAFGEVRPTQLLVEGRLISGATVFAGTWKIGLVWSGLSLLIGYLAIRKRQLAIYSGHG
ncbi:MAG: hypothetical protein GY715_04230 [Planctomycetes bacterium]|nr:hypothetical protein [Planctomycetota bacterium]